MRKKPFTLMEVMIAALILAMSVVATMSVVGTNRASVLKEERRWSREHYLTNAMEFYLAAGPAETIPDYLLPEGWRADCELNDIEDGLPDAALESIREWRLGEFVVRLYDKSGNLVAEQAVRKIIREEDVDYTGMGAN